MGAQAVSEAEPTLRRPVSAYQFKPSPMSSHGRILEFFEDRARTLRVLDVGTAAGYLGEALGRLGFHDVHGIECDASLAAEAQGFYQSLVVGDVESADLPWPEGSFDAMICADLLEHLRDPAAALGRLCRLLVPGGWMVVSLPNVAHWSVRLSLLCGRFDYGPRGLLDQTHLRFFTRRTARALVRGAGLSLRREAVTPLPFSTWREGSRWRRVWEGLERLDWYLARLRPTLCAYQIVLFSQRDEVQRANSI
jgi:2-polyprenyl-3-methyl-5-hydroxy-6-metoxy-1,4-benzoquinol methylase